MRKINALLAVLALLSAALAVRALAGSSGNGTLSVGKVSVQMTLEGENRLEVKASPGSPRCDACHGTLELAFADGDGGPATVACVACKTSAVYETPAAALHMNGGTLRAAMVLEHRKDRAAVKMTASPGAVAIQCPSCGASLPASQETKFATCTFCHTVSRIPDRTWFQLSGKEPVREPMWLYFRGHSPLYEAEARRVRADAIAVVEAKARGAAAWAATQARQREEAALARQAPSFVLGRWLGKHAILLVVLLVVVGAVSLAGALYLQYAR